MSAPAIVSLGTVVPGFGTLAGVRTADGERSYFLLVAPGTVAMIDQHTLDVALGREPAHVATTDPAFWPEIVE